MEISKIASNDLPFCYAGGNKVSKIYDGSTEVWTPATLHVVVYSTTAPVLASPSKYRITKRDDENIYDIVNMTGEDITYIRFEKEGATENMTRVDFLVGEHINNLSNLFYQGAGTYFDTLESVNFGDEFRLDQVTTMYSAFNECRSLAYINFGSIKTSSVTSFDDTFKTCESLVCITGLDTSSITADETTMFLNTPLLQRPSQVEQDQLSLYPGMDWVNSANCP